MKSLLSPPFSSFCPRPTKINVGLPFSSSKSPFAGRRSASERIGSAAPYSSSFRPIRARGVRMSSGSSHSGEVHVIVGPMFAGKRTALLRRIELETSNGRNVAVIKSNKDTRYGLDSVVTHDGARLSCLALAELSSFKQKLGLDAYDKMRLSFLGDLYDFCREAAHRDGKSVIVAGLDCDYMRRRFGSVLDIIPLADSVTKLSGPCELCGKWAGRQHHAGGQVALIMSEVDESVFNTPFSCKFLHY